MVRFATVIFIVICLIAILYSFLQTYHQMPYYVRLAGRLMDQHIIEMSAEGYTVTMTGGGMMSDINRISLGFEIERAVTLQEARSRYVTSVERLLSSVNRDTSIRPYLHTYPFDANSLTYRMSFQEVPVNSSGAEPIVYVSLINGHIFYCVYNPNFKSTNPLQTVHSEPYAEAVCIVRDNAAPKPAFE